jgi:alcohol dehydrogenase (cytochrome c)
VSYPKFWRSLPIALLVTQGLHAESTSYATVTGERLQHPEAGDWLMYRRTYDGSGFSPLRQITAANIVKLSLAWSVNTDLVEAHETTPIVNHGRMFVTRPQNNVIALNAKTGVSFGGM